MLAVTQKIPRRHDTWSRKGVFTDAAILTRLRVTLASDENLCVTYSSCEPFTA
jgi:hypothetical protein